MTEQEQKKGEGCWRVVSYKEGMFCTHSFITCSVCGTKKFTVTSMLPKRCNRCGSRMTSSIVEKIFHLEEMKKGTDNDRTRAD